MISPRTPNRPARLRAAVAFSCKISSELKVERSLARGAARRLSEGTWKPLDEQQSRLRGARLARPRGAGTPRHPLRRHPRHRRPQNGRSLRSAARRVGGGLRLLRATPAAAARGARTAAPATRGSSGGNARDGRARSIRCRPPRSSLSRQRRRPPRARSCRRRRRKRPARRSRTGSPRAKRTAPTS